jgi:nitrogen regulatory protein P-II 1
VKAIVAFIRPSKEEAVREALHGIPGLSGASFSDMRGFGRGRGLNREEARDEAVVGSLHRVRVEVMVSDATAALVEQAILTAAHTGQRGDGKLYVLPLGTARRISTGENGDTAV